MSQHLLFERFFESLISGDREEARGIVGECVEAEVPAERVVDRLLWPTLEKIEQLYRQDQLERISHHLATRLLRMLADQMQLRLEQSERRDKRVLLLCGGTEPDELAAQMAGDLLEADGYEVHFAGGGVPHDEILAHLGATRPAAVVLFSSTPTDLPDIRHLIDDMHERDFWPQMQIVVGAGVFNRADELAQEMGADLWAKSPLELVEAMREQPDRRASADQQTVGRGRRKRAAVA